MLPRKLAKCAAVVRQFKQSANYMPVNKFRSDIIRSVFSSFDSA